MKTTIIAALIAAIAIGSALGAFAATRTIETEADVHVRVWRSVSTGNLFLSTRPEGGEWTTHNTPLDMSARSDSGAFDQSNFVTITVPLTVEVDVPDPEPTTTPTPPPTPTQAPTPKPEPGTCCEVLGMSDFPAAPAAVLEEMQEVVEFGDRRYRLEHSGPITINISHTPTGLLVRYRDAFGTRPETLPNECSFQRGEHMFFTPVCRNNAHAFASEWFQRAAGGRSLDPAWIWRGTREYFASHYAAGEAPYLRQDRFLRILFYKDPLALRRGQASDDMMAMAVTYAINAHGGSRNWFNLYGKVAAGGGVDAAFEEEIGRSLSEFYDDFEAWAANENRNLHADAYATCEEAGQSLRLQGGTTSVDAGYPDFRVPSEDDDDGDGIVCEGFVPLGNLDRQE